MAVTTSSIRGLEAVTPDIRPMEATGTGLMRRQPDAFKADQPEGSAGKTAMKVGQTAGGILGLLIEAIKNSRGAEQTRKQRLALERQAPEWSPTATDMQIPFMGK